MKSPNLIRKLNLLFALFLVLQITAQDYTWMKGPSLVNQVAVYGTAGVPTNFTNPGPRRGAGTWTDNNGNLWMFGGEGWATSTATIGMLSDLWKYNPTTNQWTYMKGPTTLDALCVYGTQGVSSPGSRPGGRRHMVTWTDQAGNLWLFGGYGWYGNAAFGYTNPQNDLWKYTIATNEWTWVKGGTGSQQYSVYGAAGVSAANYLPSERFGSVGWSDNAGNLWLFGGYAMGCNDNNGLWKYNIASGNWAWMGGIPAGTSSPGVYGSQGFPSNSNTPGGREMSVAFKDNAGNFWLFGGVGYGNSTSVAGRLNDLWRYDPSSNNWTWMSGSAVPNPYGVYGPQGVSTATAVPGGRQWATGWTDAAGDLWVFGGEGFNTTTLTSRLSDLWRYQLSTNQWTFMSGSPSPNIFPTYGTQTVASPANFWGSRQYSAAWNSPSGLWLFGGVGASGNFFTDLWKYNVCYGPGAPLAVTSASNLQVCAGNAATLSATSNTGIIQWFSSATSTTAIGTGTNFISTILSSDTVYYAGVTTCAQSASRIAMSVTVNPLPQIFAYGGGICTGNAFTINPTGAVSYTSSSGSLVVSPSVTSTFSISGTSTAGCISASPAVVSVTVGNALNISVSGPTVVCATTPLTLTANGAATYSWSAGATNNTISLTPLSTTVYTLSGFSGTCTSAATHTVLVLARPIITAPSGTICNGKSFTITPSGAATYSYAPAGPIVAPSLTSLYSISGTGANGCVSIQSGIVSVLVNNLPVLSVTPSATFVCDGDQLILTGAGADTYTWSGGVQNGIAFVPSASATYSVLGTNTLTGCSSSVATTIVIPVKPLPSLFAQAQPSVICKGDSVKLSAWNALAITWADFGVGTDFDVLPQVTTTYSVTGSLNSGCSKTIGVTVQVDPCTGIRENLSTTSFWILNPSNGLPTFECNGNCKNAIMEVYDFTGKLIGTQTVFEGLNIWKTQLPEGFYEYRVYELQTIVAKGKIVVEQ
jgi:N-acetylneuraminic acid mutarotase